MELSLLDRSRTRAGRHDAHALGATIDRAVHAEGLDYRRFWVAEHHAVPGIASGAPAVLLAAVAARTSRMRIGSGGVMLPLHQPLVVAEQFLVLEGLHPGRIDLGLGRSLGFTAPVRHALRRGLEAPDSFEADVREVRGYLEGTGLVTARPMIGSAPPIFLLATGQGMALASRLGVPLVVGGPVLDSDELPSALARYRREFRPHAGSVPRVVVSLEVTVAEDDATAAELALPEVWAMAQSRQTGAFPPLESSEAIRGRAWSPQVRRRVEDALGRAVAGGPATVRRRLEQIAERTQADELMASTSTYDFDALVASDRMLSELVA